MPRSNAGVSALGQIWAGNSTQAGTSATYTSFTAWALSAPSPTPTPSPGTTLGQDTFHRPNQTYWGTASDGQVWGGDANSNTAFSISNNTGQVASASAPQSAVLGQTATDAQVLFTGGMSSFTDSNIGAVLRWTDDNDWYKAYIDGGNLAIQKDVGDTTSILGTTPFSASAGTSYSLRFQVQGTTLSAKVWQSNGAEPADWMLTVPDSAFSSGYCGLRALPQSGIIASYTSFVATSLSGSATSTPTAAPTATSGPTATPTATNTPTSTATPAASVTPTPSAGITDYSYDSLYRLTGVSGGSSASYSYDPAGNRASMGGTSYSYDRADRITSAGSTTYTVDANGNLTARGSDSFTYDQANRLKAASVNGTSSTYAYDGDGKRTSKTVGATQTNYAYDVNAGLPVLLDDGTHKYVWGLGLAFAVDTSGNPIVYHDDGLGSVRALTDASGNVVQTYQYDEYGNVVSSSGSITQPFGYTGEVRDGETGFLYLRARYYDPTTGRFLSRDDFPGSRVDPASLQRYGYTEGDPASRVDPSGHFWWMVIGFAAGVAIDSGAQIWRNKGLAHYDWKEAAISGVGGAIGVGVGDVAVGLTSTMGSTVARVALRTAINSGGGAVIGGMSSAAMDLLHGAAINMENVEKNAAINAGFSAAGTLVTEGIIGAETPRDTFEVGKTSLGDELLGRGGSMYDYDTGPDPLIIGMANAAGIAVGSSSPLFPVSVPVENAYAGGIK